MVDLEGKTSFHLGEPALEKIVAHFDKLLEFAVGLVVVAVVVAAYKSFLLATLQLEPVEEGEVVMRFLVAVSVHVADLQ